MSKAKKLPSGSWRCLVYSHTENGKRKYESFTSDDPSANGKREAEFAAAEFALNKKRIAKVANLTLSEAIDKYIESRSAVLSPTTLNGYKKIKKYAFQDLLGLQLKNFSTELLQEAVNKETKRIAKKTKKVIAPKTVHNEYGLITAVLNTYNKKLDCTVRLPVVPTKEKELIPPEIIMDIVRDEEIELAVLLAMWLSFSMSEVRGIKRDYVDNGYITISQVVVDTENGPIEKKQAKNNTRKRKHKIPEYIKGLINSLPDTEQYSTYIVPFSANVIYLRFVKLLEKNNLPHMTFHDLRHVNASVMALLKIPDKYAQERGGWKTDYVMKKVYTHTFSDERKAVDELIDDYFSRKMQHEMQHE